MENIDDPYKILALNLTASLSNRELYKILHNAKAIRRRISKEVSNADFYGDFLDCIMVELVKGGKERQVNKYLADVSNFFFDNLDVPRLRREIRYYCNKFEKDVEPKLPSVN